VSVGFVERFVIVRSVSVDFLERFVFVRFANEQDFLAHFGNHSGFLEQLVNQKVMPSDLSKEKPSEQTSSVNSVDQPRMIEVEVFERRDSTGRLFSEMMVMEPEDLSLVVIVVLMENFGILLAISIVAIA